MVFRQKKVRVAVIQAASVLFDKAACLDKACRLIDTAGKAGSELVLLPEAFVPGYPRGLGFGMKVGSRSPAGRDLWERYWHNAIRVPGDDLDVLGEAARAAGVFLAVGAVEKDRDPDGGTLYCTTLYFDPDGQFLGRHRKLKPTGSERLIWGEGDGSTLPVYDTGVGRVGGLICWENYMPLARMAMYAKGVEIYLAPTADSRPTWQATLQHIACEGRCFVLGCNQFVTRQMYPDDLEIQAELDDQPSVMCRGGSVIVSPFGEVIQGPLYDREDILYADLDLSQVTRAKLDFDVTGHYARPDIFQLRVNTTPMTTVMYRTED